MKTNRMQMSVVAIFLAIVSLLITSTTTSTAQATVVVYKNIVPNGAATSASAFTNSVISINEAGASSLNSLGIGYEFVFFHPSSGLQINIQDLKILSATHTLKRNGVNTTWVNVPAGSYNAPGDLSKPDFVARRLDGTQSSVNLTPVVGTKISTASRFQILDFNIDLIFGTAREPLEYAGQDYVFTRDISLEYRYLGTLYTRVFSESVKVEIIPSPPSGPSEGGFITVLQVSEDNENWYPAGVPIPDPFPLTVPEIIALLPSNQTVSGLTDPSKRFYRWKYTTFGSPET